MIKLQSNSILKFTSFRQIQYYKIKTIFLVFQYFSPRNGKNYEKKIISLFFIVFQKNSPQKPSPNCLPVPADEGTRQRKRQSSTGEDLYALLKYHHSMQEKIADDMLSMARSLKEQTLLANTIIRKDTKVSTKMEGQMYLLLTFFEPSEANERFQGRATTSIFVSIYLRLF